MRHLVFIISALIAASLVGGCGSNGAGGGIAPGDNVAVLSIRSAPGGASIAIDGQDAGRRTPAEIAVDADTDVATEHVVTLTLTGRNTWSGLASVVDGDTFTFDATLVSAGSGQGAIQATSQPSGARILLDGEETGLTTPATVAGVPASRHVVEYRLNGHHAFREEVPIQAGSTAVSAPSLTQIGNGRVAGRVLDHEGNGVVGALVGVQGASVTTRTTTQGLFVLENVPAGTRTLHASTTGTSPLQGLRDNVEVVDGRLTPNMDVVTALNGASGGISGRVTRASGGALEGASVFASQAVGGNLLPDDTVTPRTAETDFNGEYSITDLPEGFWVITAAYPGLATVSEGTDTQIFVPAGVNRVVNFQLPEATGGRPQPPTQLTATAFTVPTTASRSRGAYEGLRDRFLAMTHADRWGGRPSPIQGIVSRSRTAPPGSLIEVDLAWSAPQSLNIAGYFIGRSSTSGTGYSLIDDLLNPHAGLWIDYDQKLTPGRSYFYRITSVNTNGEHSDPSNEAETTPLDQVRAVSPAGTLQLPVPTFTWDALPGAFVYAVQVFDEFPERATDPIWESDVIYAPQTSAGYGGPSLRQARTYYWVVAAGNSTDTDTANAWSFSQLVPFSLP